jgi:transcriptional regulator with XRE-family HTH domain
MIMKAGTIVKTIMEEQNKTKAELGRAVGIDEKKASDLISKRIKQENISVNVLTEMLNAMGYTMVVVPTGTKMKDGFEVTINE